MTLSIMMHEVY